MFIMWHAVFDSCTSSPFFSEEIHPFEAKCWMSADSRYTNHYGFRGQVNKTMIPFEIVFDGHMCHMCHMYP